MNCVIPGLNVKILAKGLQALGKVGSEIFIQATEDKLTFISFNQCKTVCAQFSLLYSFFSQYDISLSNAVDKEKAVTCRIHIKTVLPLLKGTHFERKLDYLKIEHVNNSDLMVFKVKYKCDDIVMVHRLKLMDPDIFELKNKPDRGINNIGAATTFYSQLLGMFGTSDDELTLEFTKNKVTARNYCIGAPHKPKSIRSQVNLNSTEFSMFNIQLETTVNFSLRPVRTAIQFAEACGLNIMGLSFERGGKPLIISMVNPTFELEFLVSTLNPDSDGLSTMTTSSLATKMTQVQMNGVHNLTCEDLEAIANENWDEFGEEPVTDQKKNNTSSKSSGFDDIMRKVSRKKTKTAESDVIPRSPESPRTKRAKFLFKRSFDPTFDAVMLNDVLVPDSDTEND